MKILIINSRYFLYGGPDKYLFGIKEIFESNGHEVIPFSIKNPQNEKTKYENYFVNAIGGNDKVFFEEYKKTPKTVYQILERQYYSFEVKKKLKKLIKDTNPDVAYILHHANKLSPSVIDACKELNIPIIMRLSDFSLACPGNFFLRESKICEECLNKTPLESVKYGCVKNSKVASLIKATSLMLHRKLKTYEKVNRIIVPSQFTLQKISKVFNIKKMINIKTPVIHNYKVNNKFGEYALCVGRLEKEKGFIHAIQAVENTDIKLVIAGDSHSGYGEKLFKYVEENKVTNISFVGKKNQTELKELYQKSFCVILPSVCYENLPNVALEAMSHSKPLISSNIGSMKEIISEGYNGYLVPVGNSEEIKIKLKHLLSNKKNALFMGNNSYQESVTTYSAKEHYKSLIEVFKEVIKNEN